MKKNYTISIPAGKFWKLYVPLTIVLGCIGLFLGLFIVDRLVMPNIVGVNRGIVQVPDITGLQFDEARDRLLSVGLRIERRGREFNDEVESGAIITQLPETGKEVKQGRRIAVTVSRGKEIATIPEMIDYTENQARLRLRREGFTVGSVRRIYSESRDADKVIDTDPPGGTKISRAMEVTILVSRGARPTHTEVPNLIGENLESARERIEENGLTVGQVNHENNPSLSPGTVISQSVSPGTQVPFESSINLVVSVIR
ncbi:PASTA domain-containing protein [Chitinispirillales bacterium ANBcel5]|uniref:PASTA domain-containing protein n=1 Tax=Cellulosispirillum alkaliphilum TaxID=3039283 RepID=UPI002A58A3B2|nr:PASTA domain-containing protein [Chitinispirillales bacterium ANBcel5]